MTQTNKDKRWHFGMKAHIDVDGPSGLVHTVIGVTANPSDMPQFAHLLHGDEVRISADRAMATRRFMRISKRVWSRIGG